jgi:hypothetical protein
VTGPDLVVDVDLVVRRGRTITRLRARHSLRGQTVQAVATDGGRVEVSRFEVSDWPARLTRACAVDAPPTGSSPAADDPGLPWDLVVGTGAALSGHRPDLYDELVARDARFGEPLRRLHASLGRLRVVGIVPGRHRIGWISWVLQADGWRALTPYVERGPDDVRRMIRVEPRRPEDLPRQIGRWATWVR